MRKEFKALGFTGIVAYANAANYHGVKEGDVIELVEEDAALMDSAHREQYGTTAVVDRMLGTDMIVKIIVPCTFAIYNDPTLGDTYFNR